MLFQSSYTPILSAERLEAFRAYPGEPEDDVLARYLWNIALCESLYPPLHLLEITLRNRVHGSISSHFGVDWLQQTGPKAVLRAAEQADVGKIIARLNKDRKILTPDRLVAGLSLGFWVFLFSKHYDFALWRKNLNAVFPHLPSKECNRKAIQQKLLRVWHLRNRVSHHEPIWRKHSLISDYEAILYLLQGLSPHSVELLNRVNRFQDVYRRGWQDFKSQQIIRKN